MVKKENEIVIQDANELVKFDNFTSVEEMLSFAQVLINSRLVPNNLKRPEQIVAVITQGRELGFGAITSINNIHNIQDRATLGIHAITALIKNAGITYKLIEDAVWVRDTGEVDTIKIPEYNYIDRRTTIRFFEMWNKEVIFNDISFTLSEATKQGLTTKDNWKKMLLIMMRTRCLAIGARFVAPHALLGLYETSEWADIKNVKVDIDEQGNVINIEN